MAYCTMANGMALMWHEGANVLSREHTSHSLMGLSIPNKGTCLSHAFL